MKKYEHLRRKAVELRTKHKMTLTEIRERLALPKTTVYYWIKDIKIPRTDKQNAAANVANKIMVRAWVKKCNKLREDAYNEGKETAPELFKDPLFRDFITIYLCEGYRKQRNSVSVVNSNPKIMLLTHKFIKKYGNLKRKIGYRIHFHADQNEEELKDYWGALLNVSASAMKTLRKSNSGKLSGRNWRSKYGLLTVRIGDTYLRSKLQAWMNYLQKDWELNNYSFGS